MQRGGHDGHPDFEQVPGGLPLIGQAGGGSTPSPAIVGPDGQPMSGQAPRPEQVNPAEEPVAWAQAFALQVVPELCGCPIHLDKALELMRSAFGENPEDRGISNTMAMLGLAASWQGEARALMTQLNAEQAAADKAEAEGGEGDDEGAGA